MSDDVDPRETPIHPRHSSALLGHAGAEEGLLTAHRSGKMHHAWLLCGPRGIGKATLAYRFARFLLSAPAETNHSLDTDTDSSTAHLVSARAHPDLLVVERPFDLKKKGLKSQIAAEDARAAADFFSRTPAMGGFRVCIVDAADDFNPHSANALLKLLEEPPRNAVFVIVAHAPRRLLPTIRSRAVALPLSPLPVREVIAVLSMVAPEADAEAARQAAELSGGSPGRALELLGSNGARLFLDARPLFCSRKLADRKRLFEIAGSMPRTGDDFQIFTGLMTDWVAGRGRAAALAGEGVDAAAWSRLAQEVGHSLQRTNTLNLDRRQLLNEAFDMMEQVAGR